MAAANPYQTPGAPVADAKTEQYSQIRLFSAAGRLGRVRYIAYSIGYSLLLSIVLAVLAAVIGYFGGGGIVLGILTGAGYIAMFVLMILLSIQRAHDFNTTGWLAIVALIPLVNLVFWFIPGSDGENRFGQPTPPNTTLTVIVALIFPIIAAVGILAAIAIPAYQQYVQRANAVQGR
ncbi:MAG: DUF805 domain-containing protein [Betaproteobacteria bacterium]|nr:DUF805 domain-containing protein [Betaproteobacteria bacterium]